MSHNLIPVVHTQLWKHRSVSKYTPQTPTTEPPSSSTPSHRPSCNCRTSNSNFAAWCALHSEELQSETLENTASDKDDNAGKEAPRTLPALQLTKSPQNEALYAGEGVYCTLSRSFDSVGVTDTEREYLYQSWYEEMLTPEGDGELLEQKVSGEEPLFSGTDEEKDAQFRDWVWGEFNGWVDYMYPDGSRDCLGR